MSNENMMKALWLYSELCMCMNHFMYINMIEERGKAKEASQKRDELQSRLVTIMDQLSISELQELLTRTQILSTSPQYHFVGEYITNHYYSMP